MSDKSLVLELPEELIELAEVAHIDLRQIVIRAIEQEIAETARHITIDPVQAELTMAEKEAELARLLPPERLAEGLRLLHEGKPIPALFAGKITMRADFDNPLPDFELPPPINRMPTREEVEREIQQSIERVTSGKYPLRSLGLNKGTAWVSDDFDDPLPDEFWLGADDAS